MTAQSLKDRVAKRLKAAEQPKRRMKDRYSRPFQSKQKPDGYRFGRPTLYRPEYCQLVIDHMAKGYSLTTFAGLIGVAPDTVYEWIKVHSAFSESMSRARPARVLALETKLLRSRDGAETKAAIFALRNADPEEWRNVKHQKHSHDVEIETLTDAQLYAIASQRRDCDDAVISSQVKASVDGRLIHD